MDKWTKEEEIKLLKMVEEKYTTEEIARELGRSYKSIMHRRADLTRGKPKEKVELKQPQVIIKPKDVSMHINNYLKEALNEIKPYAINKLSSNKSGDTLVIHLTDLHAGKIIKNQEGELIYNEEIFRTRIDKLCEQTLKLLDNNISKSVPIKNVVIVSTGDLANGEGIYATQAFEQEIAPPKQVMLIVEVISKLIISLLNRGLSVKFYGVRGNHGRTGKDTDVASNWDLMIYMILDFWAKSVLKNPNLEVKYTENEHMVFNIRNHGVMIRHIAPEQADSPSGRVKINAWAKAYNVDIIIYGHFHHAGVFDCDKVRVIRGGSTVGGDSLSDSMAKYSEPIQIVFGVNEQRTTTFIYLVDLGEKINS